jgi:hypothetical protein
VSGIRKSLRISVWAGAVSVRGFGCRGRRPRRPPQAESLPHNACATSIQGSDAISASGSGNSGALLSSVVGSARRPAPAPWLAAGQPLQTENSLVEVVALLPQVRKSFS